MHSHNYCSIFQDLWHRLKFFTILRYSQRLSDYFWSQTFWLPMTQLFICPKNSNNIGVGNSNSYRTAFNFALLVFKIWVCPYFLIKWLKTEYILSKENRRFIWYMFSSICLENHLNTNYRWCSHVFFIYCICRPDQCEYKSNTFRKSEFHCHDWKKNSTYIEMELINDVFTWAQMCRVLNFH